MQELNKCPRCGHVLVAHEEIISLRGQLFCSRNCTVRTLAEEAIMAFEPTSVAFDKAKAIYDDEAEVVRAEDVLAEDLQDVQIAVTYYKTVKVPRDLSKEKAEEVVTRLWQDGIICAEPDDCDDVQFECTLVNNNSAHRGE